MRQVTHTHIELTGFSVENVTPEQTARQQTACTPILIRTADGVRQGYRFSLETVILLYLRELNIITSN